MSDHLDWMTWPDALAREVMTQLLVAPDPARLASLDIKGQAASLPFYKHWQLVVLHSSHGGSGREPGPATVMEDVYALWREGREPVLLDGSSDPIYVANEDESLHLTDDSASDYIRFFCFALRADNGAFLLY